MMQCVRGQLGWRSDRRDGFVLIIVMVIVAMIAFAGFAFVNSMSDEYRAVDTSGDQLAADQTLASAELLVLHALEAGDAPTLALQSQIDDNFAASLLTNNPALFQDVLLRPPEGERTSEVAPRAWRFSVVSPARSAAAESIESDNIRFGLENESARLNLATLMQLDAVDPENARDVLLHFPGMTEAAADALLDWLDADSEPRQFGAEAEEYLEQPNPIQPRNGPPTTLAELLLVRGVSRPLLFGPDENRNFVVDRFESRPTDRFSTGSAANNDASVEGLGWADMLTLQSAERNANSRGEPRIDLNQSSAANLRAELSAKFSKEVADFILLYRTHGPSGATASTATGPLPFRLKSVADLIDATVAVREGSSSRLAPSPITSTSRELLDQLLDRTTTDARGVIPGRININLALRPVLAAIPGLESEAVERVISRRATLDDEQRRTPAWLLSEQIVSIEQFRQILPYITTGGDVYRAQLIAWRPVGGMTRRAEVVFDATTRPARRLAWTDLSAHGTAIPIGGLSSLAGMDQSPESLSVRNDGSSQRSVGRE